MKNEKLEIHGFEISCYSINTLVIGSGAASLNAALSLHSEGVDDILIATYQWGGGTSRNTGSDKQTYYKLSLSGSEADSVPEMARDLFNGKCMQGDIALCEAQGSVRAFMRLVDLGVEFPHDSYGSFPGYKTDHDPRSRATSAGPYTSRRMFEALASAVKRRNIAVLDNHHCVAILTDPDGTEIRGAVALNLGETDYRKAFVLFNSVNVILGTGGPAGIYETSVYPHSQNGSTGMAFMAGASGQNLTESQFGIASVKFRWNLSGSYQQVIPRYISTDEKGNDTREFLADHFPDLRSIVTATFLKGYQWPFDPGKIREYGSSMIDLLIDNEINTKHRKVFLDYTRNPSGPGGETFSVRNLDPVVESYLKRSGALKDTPYQRLLSMNAPAVALYHEHGTDLSVEHLQIAVCAQHNNGGLKGNIWWESDLKHLFPVGEVNGSHGVQRPGGSALNSGQVGSLRAAEFIRKRYNYPPLQLDDFIQQVKCRLPAILDLSSKWIEKGYQPVNKIYLNEIRSRMSECCGIIRNGRKISEAVNQASLLNMSIYENTGAASVKELSECFQLADNCITHFIYLSAALYYIENGGRSRGSYIVTDGMALKDLVNPDLCLYDRDAERMIAEVNFKHGKPAFRLENVRDIPEQELWFEKIWKEYLEDI